MCRGFKSLLRYHSRPCELEDSRGLSFRPRGILHLVVGPSGAGKDSVMMGAAARLAADPRFVFARRCVSRLADAPGENHIPLTSEEFRRRQAEGAFCCAWHAHGLDYGVPRTIEDDLAAGRSVIVNVSRELIDDLRRRLAPIRVLLVTAPPAILAARLAARGRETEAEILERLHRAGEMTVDGRDVVTITNDGPLERAVDRFVAVLG